MLVPPPFLDDPSRDGASQDGGSGNDGGASSGESTTAHCMRADGTVWMRRSRWPPLRRPAPPDAVIDPALRPAWEVLRAMPSPRLRRLASLPLRYGIPVLLAPSEQQDDQDAAGGFANGLCADLPGVIWIAPASLSSPDARAVGGPLYYLIAVLAHEFEHVDQVLSGCFPCHCTVQKEYLSTMAELEALLWVDPSGAAIAHFLPETIVGAATPDGPFVLDLDRLYAKVQSMYPGCPLE